jgi:hypothetical protein
MGGADMFHPIVFSHLYYLDPGSGSYIFQVIIAALVGALFLIKVYWRRIRTFMARRFGREPKDED